MSNRVASLNPILVNSSISVDSPPAVENHQPKHAVPEASSRRNTKTKKIWIDLDNSPHVPFFLPIIDELRKKGYEVDVTARDMYQVCQLLDFFNLKCKVIGGHYGKNKVFKVLGSLLRASQLIPTAARFHADLAISHGSRAQVLACKALRIPTIMMHDYEHSTKTGFIEADWIFMPDMIPDNAMSSRPEQVFKYPGLKEDVYVPRFTPDPSILNLLGISEEALVVTLRPPATEAHYHNPEAEELFAEAVRLLSETPKVRAVVLPRNAKQGEQLRRQWAELISCGTMIIPTEALDGLNLIWYSDLMISGGGTMNREAAALGVPVYSVFRGKIGAVDKYLEKHGRLTLLENIEDVRGKLVLERRDRPAHPENRSRPALHTIVENIVTILEKK